MTAADFAALCEMHGAEYTTAPWEKPSGFSLECDFQLIWAANDGGEWECSYVALVQDSNGWCWCVEGGHDATGWGCQAGVTIRGPVTLDRAFDPLFVSRDNVDWDRDGFERARARWEAL